MDATEDVTKLDARAVRASVALVSRVTQDDLGKPTPCQAWTLGDLLAHMTVQHHGFAASAHGHGADLAIWQAAPPQAAPAQADPASADPVKAYAEAADVVLAAFAEDGVLDRAFALPEILPGVTFPGAQAVSFHLVDYVVHSWDVARALGLEVDLDRAVLAAGLKIAELVPGGSYRTQPGAAFAPALPTPAGNGPGNGPGEAALLDQIVAILGRSPTWPA